jgi:NADPH:quinone reductase-like Zn-dependent oxidoreductase
VPLAALTAWGAVIDTARAHEGQRVLVHAAAGGVGHFAVQLATYFGAEVTATCSERNVDFVRSLGARHVVDYAARRFEDVVADQDVVIDLVGNVVDDTGTRSLDVLRPHGLVVNVPSGSWPTMAEEAAARGIRATGYSVSPDARTLGVITRLIDDGSLRVHVDREFPSPTAQRRTACSRRGTCAASSCCASRPTRSSGGRGLGAARYRLPMNRSATRPRQRVGFPALSRCIP